MVGVGHQLRHDYRDAVAVITGQTRHRRLSLSLWLGLASWVQARVGAMEVGL